MIPLGLDMMDALQLQDITLSVLSATHLGNRSWLQALRTYFLQAEEVSKPLVLWLHLASADSRCAAAKAMHGFEHTQS